MPIYVDTDELREMYELLQAEFARQPVGTVLSIAYHEASVGILNLMSAIEKFREAQDE